MAPLGFLSGIKNIIKNALLVVICREHHRDIAGGYLAITASIGLNSNQWFDKPMFIPNNKQDLRIHAFVFKRKLYKATFRHSIYEISQRYHPSPEYNDKTTHF